MNKIEMGTEIAKAVFYTDSDNKKAFLNKMNEDSEPKTTMLMLATLLKIDEAEGENKKPWYDFSESMVKGAFIGFESKSIITLQSYLSIIKKYLAYVTPQSDTMKVGFLYTISLEKKDLYEFISKIGEELRYITPNEFKELVEESKAPSICKCVFILTYLGVKGHEYSDIYNIKIEDINFETGEITQDGKHLCKIPSKYVGLFKDATINEQFIRVDHNGNTLDESTLYLDTPYLAKRKIWRTFDPTQQPDKYLISNLFSDMKLSLKNPEVSISSLYASGLCYKMIERYGRDMPRHKDLMEFRKETGVKLGFETMKACCRVLLDKLEKEEA